MFISVFLIALLTPVNAFASQTNDSMEVRAYIEAPTEEPSSPANINTDSNSVQTVDDGNLDILIPLLFIICGALVVTVVYVKRKKHTAQ